MVINVHNDHRRNSLARPGMIPPSLTKAVASNFPRDADRQHCPMNDAPRLNPADGLAVLPVAHKNELAPLMREIEA